MKKAGVFVFVVIGILGFGVLLYYLYSNQVGADIFADQDYVIFNKPTFENVYMATEPQADEIVGPSGISTFASRGELQPVTFSVRSKKDLGHIKINISDLSSGEGVIPAENIQIYNIKNWDQCKLDKQYKCLDEDAQTEVPELLIKDDEQDVVADEIGYTGSEYIPPSLNQGFDVIIEKDVTHTFYVLIDIPDSAKSGNYRSDITFDPDQSQLAQIPLNLEVLSITLPDLEKDNLLYYAHETAINSAGNNKQRVVTRQVYSDYLKFFKDEGVNGLVLFQSVNEELKWTADEMKRLGYNGKVILIGSYWGTGELNIKEQMEYFQKLGFDVYFYGKDEPFSVEKMKEQLEISHNIHEAGGKVATAIRKECDDAIRDPETFLYQNDPPTGWEGEKYRPTETIDLPLYSTVETNKPWCQEAGNPSIKKYTWLEHLVDTWEGKVVGKDYQEGFYRQLWIENARRQRIDHGFFFWTSKLDVTAPWAVGSYYLSHGKKQYDEFDANRKGTYALYPSQEGPVRTMQWEGYRKGIDDMRYVQGLEELITKLKKSDSSKYEAVGEQLKEKMEPYVWGFDKAPHEQLTDADTEQTKRWVAEKIIELQGAMVTPTPSPPPSVTTTPVITPEIDLSPGYNAYAPPSTNSFSVPNTDANITPISFNISGDGTWSIYRDLSTFRTTPDIGYYILNKEKVKKKVLMTESPNTTGKATLNKGWNLLANSQNTSRGLADFKYTFAGGEYNLEQLLVKGLAYKTLHIVIDDKATTAEKALEPQTFSSPGKITIPPKEIFWFYIW